MIDDLDRPDDFNVETTRIAGDTILLALEGQVDFTLRPSCATSSGSAIEDGAVNVVVDLSDTTFIDSMTLGVLLGAVKRLRPRGASFAWSAATPTSARSSRSPSSIASLDAYEGVGTERLVPTG